MITRLKGFTLIELLIVVAIIAILAAIAVPNFLEAQVRAKIGRAKADMRSVATAMESFRMDNNDYPLDSNYYFEPWGRHPKKQPVPPYPDILLFSLTTPVAYMTAIPANPWPNITWRNDVGQLRGTQYDYVGSDWIYTQELFGNGIVAKHRWALSTVGPDRRDSGGVYVAVFGDIMVTRLTPGGLGANSNNGGLYDPTNGTMSAGDIVRVGP